MNQSRPQMEDVMKGKLNRLPLLWGVLQQLHQYFLVPHGLALMAALAVIAIAAQTRYDVKSPMGKRYPVSLALLLLAASGERKSTVSSRLMKPIKAYQKVLEADFREKLMRFENEVVAWKEEKRILERSLRATEPHTAEHDETREMLTEHLLAKPVRPKLRQLVHEDVSPTAFLQLLAEFGSASLFSTEASTAFDGKFLDAYGHVNAVLSGEDRSVDRFGRDPIRIEDPRATLAYMIQPDVLDAQKGRKIDKLRDSGFVARLLVFYPESMVGKRFMEKRSPSTDFIEKFDDRIVSMLDDAHHSIIKRGVEREVIELSEEASETWCALSDEFEGHMADGQMYERAKDHASKLTENITRLAALLHVFEGFEGPISRETLEVAIDIAEVCSNDFMEVFVPPPQEQQDAILLDDFLSDRFRSKGTRYVRKLMLRQRSPNRLRKDGRCNAALEVLAESGSIALYCDEKNAECVDLLPHLPPPIAPMSVRWPT